VRADLITFLKILNIPEEHVFFEDSLKIDGENIKTEK